MSLIGLWSKQRNVYGKTHVIMVLLIQFIHIISIFANLIQCNGNLNCSFENLTYSVITISSIFTMFVFLVHEDLYYDAWDTLNAMMETFQTHKYTLRAEIVTRRITLLCFGYASFGLLHHNVVPLLDYDNCIKRNTSESALTCGLPTSGAFPFDTSQNPGYALAYTFQVVSAITCIQAVVQPSMLSASIVYHTIGQLYMIQHNLTELKDDNENKHKKLKNIIKHHSAVIEFSKIISDAFNRMLLMYAVILAIIFSISGFQVINIILGEIDWWIMQRYIIIFVGYGVLCWCFSLLGQKLIDECNGKLNCTFENLTYSAIQVSSIFTMLVFLTHEDLYYRAWDTLNTMMKTFQTHKYTIRVETVTRRITVLCTGYSILGLIHYNLSPIIDYDNCLKRNISDTALTCGLPTSGAFPFDTTRNPGYMLAYTFQAISSVILSHSVMQPSMVSASIIYHIIGQLNMIQDNLIALRNDNENKHKKLKNIITHHSAVIEFSKLTSQAFNRMLLLYAVMLAIIFSVSVFQVISMVVREIDWWIMQRYLIISFGFGVICWCFSFLGQKLIDEVMYLHSTQIATCAYNIKWYEENLVFQTMIKFMVLRSNKPLIIRSASISDVSFASFTKVVSTTYSYLAMMYKVMILSESK
ncbi:hypothetical protein FQR65_LT07955 [Abscondita terminalis]|nr:hypothetical protein FQR65_LT07955 [Abscondita terminalis]